VGAVEVEVVADDAPQRTETEDRGTGQRTADADRDSRQSGTDAENAADRGYGQWLIFTFVEAFVARVDAFASRITALTGPCPLSLSALLVLTAATLLTLAGCGEQRDSPIQSGPDMKKQEKFKPQGETEDCSRTSSSDAGPRKEPVARGHMTEETPYQTEWKARCTPARIRPDDAGPAEKRPGENSTRTVRRVMTVPGPARHRATARSELAAFESAEDRVVAFAMRDLYVVTRATFDASTGSRSRGRSLGIIGYLRVLQRASLGITRRRPHGNEKRAENNAKRNLSLEQLAGPPGATFCCSRRSSLWPPAFAGYLQDPRDSSAPTRSRSPSPQPSDWARSFSSMVQYLSGSAWSVVIPAS